MKNPETHIVAGVSCAGKSTFIDGSLLKDLRAPGGVDASQIDVLFAGKLIRQFGLAGDSPQMLDLGPKPVRILHYNLLRPLENSDPLLPHLLALPDRFHLYVCYAPDAEIRARMAGRRGIEPELAPSDTPYPSDRFLQGFGQIDQRKLVLSFAGAFQAKCTDIRVIFSNPHRCAELTWQEFTQARPSHRLEAALTSAT